MKHMSLYMSMCGYAVKCLNHSAVVSCRLFQALELLSACTAECFRHLLVVCIF